MADFEALLKTVTGVRAERLCRPRVRIQVVSGPDTGMQYDFDERVRLGTRKLADMVLKDPKVSGLHCELFSANGVRLRDLGSKNGTWIRGLRVGEAMLPPGEPVTLGDTHLSVTPVDDLVEIPLHESDQFFGVVGRSAAVRAMTARLERLAVTDTTVLITGETGSGKECVAEALHLGGKRAKGPLVIVDCGSLPANLIESELFGHERGSFTGAVASHKGAFERASGGTIFLDEIGELPLDLQPKLLRALESREVRPIGAAATVPIDVRVIAATHRDLALDVSKGRFREDLYYRLAVVTLTVPPLRDRMEDVPILAVHLLREMGVDPSSYLTADSLAALAAYEWPGNVRELRNTLERAVALSQPATPEPKQKTKTPAGGRPSVVDLSRPLRVGKQLAVDAYERAYVMAMLDQCGGNISEVARRSGMDRMSIHRIIQRLGLRERG